MRGVGVHHAGVLPKYRRIVEELFQQKLLSVAVCTETLSAGINLPARSVVLPSILKGPPGKKRVIDPSTAHQIFGRAGRPQFDTQGYVFVLAHEDDVKIARWKEKYDQIPEDTKDPGLLKAKKDLKRKMPKRRETEQYWNEAQFEKLRAAARQARQPRAAALAAAGLHARRLARSRPDPHAGQQAAAWTASRDRGRPAASWTEMLLTLWRGGYVTLEPEPPKDDEAPAAEPPPRRTREARLALTRLRSQVRAAAARSRRPYRARLGPSRRPSCRTARCSSAA